MARHCRSWVLRGVTREVTRGVMRGVMRGAGEAISARSGNQVQREPGGSETCAQQQNRRPGKRLPFKRLRATKSFTDVIRLPIYFPGALPFLLDMHMSTIGQVDGERQWYAET